MILYDDGDVTKKKKLLIKINVHISFFYYATKGWIEGSIFFFYLRDVKEKMGRGRGREKKRKFVISRRWAMALPNRRSPHKLVIDVAGHDY